MLIGRLNYVLNEAGYYGYSMSNNARSAYQSGKKPLSQWTKGDIISQIEGLGICSGERMEQLRKLPLKILRNVALVSNEWHHTSSMYNRTDFYEIDEDKLECSDEEWKEYLEAVDEDKKQETTSRERGKFFWLTWEGTRNHPRAREHELLDAYVETRGSFYYVYDSSGSLVVKKKIGSNGTEFIKN